MSPTSRYLLLKVWGRGKGMGVMRHTHANAKITWPELSSHKVVENRLLAQEDEPVFLDHDSQKQSSWSRVEGSRRRTQTFWMSPGRG